MEPKNINGQVRTQKYIICNNPELILRIKKLLAALPFYFTLQPLKTPVAYRIESNAKPTEKYFRVDLIGYHHTNNFLRNIHAEIIKEGHYPKEYLDGLNHQQAVQWRIKIILIPSNGPLWWKR